MIPGAKAVFMHKIAELLTLGNICIGDFLTKWYQTKPTTISYGATDIPKKTIVLKKHNIPHFLYIGRLEEEAGILDYIKALVILKSKGLQSKLTILGDGSQRKQAEEIIKKSDLSVEFKGFVNTPEQYLPTCDYVFVSRYLGILEAFAYKKFVFTIFNNNIKKDYLTMTPFTSYIDVAENAQNLADQIQLVLHDTSQQKANIENAYNWVKRQTWEELANEYLTLWNK
jgi:glycosyltransferase involved in cell wall biosynthesis